MLPGYCRDICDVFGMVGRTVAKSIVEIVYSGCLECFGESHVASF